MNNLDATDVLLKSDVKISVQDNSGSTALHYACDNLNIEMILKLISHGCDPTIRDSDGKTGLDIVETCDSSSTHRLSCIEIFKNYKKDNDSDNQQMLPQVHSHNTISSFKRPTSPSTFPTPFRVGLPKLTVTGDLIINKRELSPTLRRLVTQTIQSYGNSKTRKSSSPDLFGYSKPKSQKSADTLSGTVAESFLFMKPTPIDQNHRPFRDSPPASPSRPFICGTKDMTDFFHPMVDDSAIDTTGKHPLEVLSVKELQDSLYLPPEADAMDIMITIESCSNCSHHSSFTHHNESKYFNMTMQCFSTIVYDIANHSAYYAKCKRVYGTHIRNTSASRIGAFEIYLSIKISPSTLKQHESTSPIDIAKSKTNIWETKVLYSKLYTKR